ncbi:MAG: (2Fe-2S) ferredoxin domain-containing protein [Epulopiscium sp.]|nr:(2Fe-2S) ferredoxin domain-containing protein [Candidatus Epulonipiscium sp.]
MEVKVCVGSACYVKGSHEIIESLQNLINKHRLQDKVELKAAFCLEHCTNAVAVQVDDDFFEVDPNKIDEFFDKHIKEKVTRCK